MIAETGSYLLADCTIATSAAAGVLPKAALVIEGGRIAAFGPLEDMVRQFPKIERIDLAGRLVTPGLIDCHTHLVHAGSRADEFELRQKGANYEDIARAGGGILSTVAATRAASEQDLVELALPRLDRLLAEGVTTIEIKSGYGLDDDTEIRMLKAARRLGEVRPVRVVTSYLGAHALPADHADRRENYIGMLCDAWLPRIAQEGLADAVDGFCERIAFTPAEMRRVFSTAAKLGLPVKLHADQLSNMQGAALSAEFRALSADHIEYTDEAGVAAMAKAGTVGVLLPGAFYFLRETQKPPIAALRRAGVPMAVATDCNPGSSPLTSLLLAMNMAAVLFGLTVEECLLGVTKHAAAALGLGKETGSIEIGKRADLAIWDASRPADLICRMGFNPLYARIWGGQWLKR